MNILMIHGFLGDKHIGMSLLKQVKNPEIKVFSVTLPGHDGIPLGTIDSIAGLAVNVRTNASDCLKLPYIVAGYSLGGCVALKYSELYQDDPNLKGVVVWSSPVFGHIGPTAYVGNWFLKNVPEPVFKGLQTNKKLNNRLTHLGINMSKSDKLELVKIIKIIRTDCVYDFNTSICKLFIYKDMDDIVLPINYKKLLKAQPKNAQIELIHNIGHMPSAKTLQILGKRITAFCEEVQN